MKRCKLCGDVRDDCAMLSIGPHCYGVCGACREAIWFVQEKMHEADDEERKHERR